ncbi:hypothetical protein CS557_08235 [Acinetobacter junii]|uniref:Uncharacterized protein n=2 Tax=Acinetobacter TaxID=469 RepID=A0AB35K5K9_9GAMM|nr:MULTISPECIES: hypothetical protein [Acinetobacter]ATU45460.1 hypothetical protein CS557_08235 [Acinetobacter junii]MDD9320148.1 hypothetical protein [Acinetobacter lactucae]RSO34243.1 hypothetical protein EA763_10550 [Acinetobacter lactucae]
MKINKTNVEQQFGLNDDDFEEIIPLMSSSLDIISGGAGALQCSSDPVVTPPTIPPVGGEDGDG